MIRQADGVAGRLLLGDKSCIGPGIDRRGGTIVEINPEFVKRFREHRDAAGIKQRWSHRGITGRDLFKAGDVWVPIHPD